LLRDALESYQGLLAAADDPDPALRHETAEANLRVARILKYLGRLDEAIKHVDAGMELLTALPDRRDFRESLAAACLQKATLCRSRPGGHGAGEQFAAARRMWTELAAGDGARYEVELASCDSEEALWHMDVGRWELAEAAFNRALAVRQRRAAGRPDRQLAETLHNLGMLYANSGRAAPALQFGAEAARAYEALARSGDDEDARLRWGTALNNLGVYQRGVPGHSEAARVTHELAIKVRAALADAHPRVPSLRAQLAESCLNLSGTLTSLGRPAEAVEPGRRAVAVIERSVADGGDVASRDMLVAALTNLALACQNARRDDEALAAYARALGVVTAIINEDPNHLSARATLAGLCTNRGNFERDRGRAAAGMPWYARAIEAAEAALARNPQYADAKGHREVAHGSRAQAHEALGDDASAVRDWDRLVTLADGPRQTTYRYMRAPALQRAGLVDRVAGEVDHLAGGADDAEALAFLAEVCAGGARHPALAWRCVRLTPRAWAVSDWPGRAKLVVDVMQSEKWRPMRARAVAALACAARHVRQY
jgi:tetratricopeptide (TPR) repeat protein